jgi:hypothetical protein
MCQRGINMLPAAWVIDKDHEGHCGASKYIKRKIPLVQENYFKKK